jgi:hypothetical protein
MAGSANFELASEGETMAQSKAGSLVAYGKANSQHSDDCHQQ